MDGGTINLLISIVMCVIGIVTFSLGRKDKGEKDSGDSAYKNGRLEEKVDTIKEQIKEVLRKLDTIDMELDAKIDKAFKQHIEAYHSNNSNKGE